MSLRKSTMLGLGVMAAVFGSAATHAATVAISCGSVGVELQLCKEAADAWAQKTGNTVKVVSTPNDGSQRLALYQQLLAAKAPDIDVFQIDVVWPGLLGEHLLDLKKYSKGAESQYFAPIIQNNTYDSKLVAMPWFVDAGLLYYRKDLLDKYGLQVPTTWEDLTADAKKIQEGERKAGNDKFWGYVWQGRAYEGLTCDATEWVVSYNGGSIIEPNGKVSVDNPNAVKALTTAASWIGDISPDGVLNYAEEEARGVWQSGNAAFMRNWPYAYSLGNSDDSPIKGKFGVTALPMGGKDGRHAAAMGGQELAVSKYSKNPEAAADLVMYLTSYEEQKRRAIKNSFNPTIKALYQDKEVLEAQPFMGELYDTFVNAAARPSTVTGAKYNEVSNEFWNAVHAVLSGKENAQTSLASLQKKLNRMSHGGKW